MLCKAPEVNRNTASVRPVELKTQAEFDSLKADWQGLEYAVGDLLLPFHTFAWNQAWWKAFAKKSFIRIDRLRIISFYAGKRLVAVHPMFETQVGVAPYASMRYLRPFGADPNLTEIRAPLCLPEYQGAVMETTLGLMAESGSAPSLLHLIGPAEGVDTAAGRHGHLRAIKTRDVMNYILPLGSSWEAFRAGLKRNIKESLRHCYNSLARAGLDHALHVYSSPADLKKHLPGFYRLHALRAVAANSSVAHPDYFASERNRRFIEDAIHAMGTATACRPYIFCLRSGDEAVAMRLAFRCGNDMYLYYSGFEPAYARFSVMTTLLAETFKWCIANGVANANMSVGTDVSKTRWGPFSIRYQEMHFVKPSVKGWLVESMLTLGKKAMR